MENIGFSSLLFLKEMPQAVVGRSIQNIKGIELFLVSNVLLKLNFPPNSKVNLLTYALII